MMPPPNLTTQLNAALPIVLPDRSMTPPFRDFMNDVFRTFEIRGSGSPEGVIAAPQYARYLDIDGTAGALEYRKMLTDIAGDKTQGWVAI
jgi:hypothetical protein